MGIKVVMELEGDNDDLYERLLHKMCEALDSESGGRVYTCVLTTGKVTIEEEFDGSAHRRPQRTVR